MNENTDKLEHEIIRSEIRAILIQNESNNEVMNNILKSLIEQNKLMNDRLIALESDTDIIRIIKKYKWLIIILAIGFYNILKTINIEKWINSILY